MEARNEVLGTALGPIVQSGSIVGGVHFHRLGERHDTPNQLPPAPANFTNRMRELQEIEHAVSTEPVAGLAKVVLVTGQGGVGKTALCLQWGHQRRTLFPDGQLYADIAEAPKKVLSRFLVALGVRPERVPTDEEEQAALFRSLTADRRLLVIADNATSSDVIRNLFPASSTAVVLVTSRHRLVSVLAAGATLVEVRPLELPDAIRLLKGSLRERVMAEPEAARKLAELCGGLPLALRVVGARLVSRPRWTIRSLATSLADERHRLTALSLHGGELSIRAVFDLSYDALSPAAAQLYRTLGVHPGREFGVHVSAAGIGATVKEARTLVNELVDANLLEELSADRYRLHDLVRLHAYELATDVQVRRMLDWYLHTARAAGRLITPHRPDIRQTIEFMPVEPLNFDDEAGALEWFVLERANLLVSARYAVDNGFPTLAWQISESMWGLFLRRAYYVDWIAFDTIGIEAARRCGDLAAEAEAVDRIGLAYNALEMDIEALRHMTRAQSLWHELRDQDRMASSLVRLGIVYQRQGDIERAVDHFTRALDRQRDLGSLRAIGLTLRRLGDAQLDAGRVDDAIEHLQESLVILESLPISDRYNSARTLTILGRAQARAGMVDDARVSLTSASATMRAVGSVSGEADALSAFGELNERLGDLAGALAHYEKTLVLLEQIDNPGVDRLRAKMHALRGLVKGP